MSTPSTSAFTRDDAIGLTEALRRWGICASSGQVRVDEVE